MLTAHNVFNFQYQYITFVPLPSCFLRMGGSTLPLELAAIQAFLRVL
jgi:hypothetical protein